MTTERIEKYIEVFRYKYLPRLQKLKRYYDSKNDLISNREFADKTLPNNKIINSWADYVCNISTNYFIGKPVTYNAQNEELLSELNAIYRYNDEITTNNTLALNSSIYGYSVELIYLDNNSNVRFAPIEVENTILIYDNSIEKNLLYAIRYFEEQDILTNQSILNVELYSETDIKYFTKAQNSTLILTGVSDHYFKNVPVNVYKNNFDLVGDFQKVMPLIDAYDVLQSTSLDENESFREAYLVFKNTNLDSDSILQMKETRNIVIEDTEQGMQSDVDFLVKNGNPTESEANKQRIEDDILRFTFMGNMTEQKSHTSSTGSQLGLMGLEQVMSKKQAYFQFGLTRRIEIICELLNIKGNDYDFRDVSIVFTKNVPIDNVVIADTISKLRGLVSDETLLLQLPFIQDIEVEKERLTKQNELNSYANLFGGDVVE